MNMIPAFNLHPIPLLLAAAGFLTLPAFAQVSATALPTGGVVSAGSAAISQAGAAMRIDQASQRAVIDWTRFNIGRDASVHFQQPNAAAIALNRVGADGGRSIIDGRLTATGQVWLLNPGGALIGPNARVDVGGLLVSSLKLGNDDFLSGNIRFTKDGAGNIVNQGTLTAAEGGYIALMAPEVRNEGIITARLGAVALASGEELRLDFSGDRLIEVRVDKAALDGLVENKNLIQADGGWVLMSTDAASRLAAGAVNNTGIVQAQTVAEHEGVIRLLGGSANVAGTLDASAPNGGNGGFIETSGHTVNVDSTTRVTTAAPNGQTGMWLIDPNDYVIAASGGHITGAALSSNLGSTSVTIDTATMGTTGNGDVFVNDALSWNSGNTLILQAERDIAINKSITADNGGLTLTAVRDVWVKDYVRTNTMAVNARDVNVQAGSIPAELSAWGDQTITASGEIRLTAAASGFQKSARIRAYGDQNISANGITLTAGGSGSTDADNVAEIRHEYCKSFNGTACTSTGSGNQTITLTGANAWVRLTGGAGSGLSQWHGDSSCTAAGLGDQCKGSSNRAEIQNQLGTQTLAFQQTGGTVGLLGGDLGAGNSAEINNWRWEYWSNGSIISSGPIPGEQKILGSPDITLIGGSSGGRVLYYNNDTRSIENEASIGTDGSLQTIRARNITLKGSADGASGSAVSGAWLGIEPETSGTNATQDIVATGNVTITGGASGLIAASNDSTKSDFGSWAIISAESKYGSASSTITVGGTLSVAGEKGIAGFGSKGVSSFDIRVTGTATLDAGSSHGAVVMGSVGGTTAASGYVDWSSYIDKIRFAKAVSGSSLMLRSDASGDAIKLFAPGGNLVNDIGSGILATPNGRWLIYQASPTGEVLGGLAANFRQYGCAGYNCTITGSGHGLIYASAAPATAPTTTATTAAETTVNQESTASSSTATTTPVATTAPAGGIGGGGATLDNFPVSSTATQTTTTQTTATQTTTTETSPTTTTEAAATVAAVAPEPPPPPPKLIVDASKSVPRRAGVLNRGELHALNKQVHEARAQLFSGALTQLASNPAAADIPDCVTGGAEMCIASQPVKMTENYIPEVNRKVAVLIGNNAYRSPIPELETAVNDVTAIAAELKDKLGYEVRIIQNAGRGEIVEALNGLIRDTGRDDSVLVMYAGHGYLDEKQGKGYWIPTDASTASPDKWISNDTIAKALANVPAKQVMLVSDSCYSGSLTKEGKVLETVGASREQTLTRRSVTALSSGGEEPVSDEGRDNHSIFAWNMIQSLKQMKAETSGNQLHTRIKESVSREFPQTPQYGVIASAGHADGGEYLLTPKGR